MAKKPKSSLGIASILDSLKKEFNEIEEASKGKVGKYGFDVKGIELELQFTVSKKGKAGVNIWVVELGGEYAKEELQTIKIKLDPYQIDEDGFKHDLSQTALKNLDEPLRKPIHLKRKATRRRISLRKSARR
ncbi:MAG: hypothetical protein IIA83_04725 [Thaumarchaeota archaeon]|nr:hypothetical protein [Nitrososphaerota archaeon]